MLTFRTIVPLRPFRFACLSQADRAAGIAGIPLSIKEQGPMETEALERPADLTIWRTTPVSSPVAQPERYDTLREAIKAAAGALTDPAKQPWIITEEGEILSPNWIRTYLN